MSNQVILFAMRWKTTLRYKVPSVLQCFSASSRHEMTRFCSMTTSLDTIDLTTRAQPPQLNPVRHASSSRMNTIPTTMIMTMIGSDGSWGTNVPKANSRDFRRPHASLQEVSGGYQPLIQQKTMESYIFMLDNSTTIDTTFLPKSSPSPSPWSIDMLFL